jgi:glycosyltransferase involved in cell wall biosynthesis
MKTKLKVVIVITVPYVVKCHLPNTLKRMPADFEVCVVGRGVSEFSIAYPDIKWKDINIERKATPFSDLWALLALCWFFLEYRPNIVHSLMPKAGLIAAIAGFICRIPVRIHTFTGQIWATQRGIKRILLRYSDFLTNLLNTVCLTDSASQSAFLYDNKISFKGKPLPFLLHGSLSGIDTTRFDLNKLAEPAIRLRNSLGIAKGDFIFTYIARKTRDKGAIDMLKAFSSLQKVSPRNTKLLFIGPDEDGEIMKLRATSPEFFLNVIDVEFVDNHEVYLALTDVLCLPSYREGFGSIVIDAAALGIPTIGSNISGLTDSVLDGKTGVLFPVGDLDKFLGEMLRIIENLELRKQLGVNAKERVETYFTADLLYDSLKNFYYQQI